MTPLDEAHGRMTAAPDDDIARMRFLERLADAELFLLLEGEPQGEVVTPQIYETQGETLVLVFDREARLAEFVGAVAPSATLSGRVLAEMLAAQGLGLVLNPEVAPSSYVLDAAGVRWLHDTLSNGPEEHEDRFAEINAPMGLPEVLLSALDQKLAMAEGMAQAAFLVGTKDANGRVGHLLGFLGALPAAEGALARAASEALTFSGIEAGTLDVCFFDGNHPMAERLARVGLRFDLPQPQAPIAASAPGRDPEKPPILK